jgi:uncharacterized protein
MKKNDLTLKTVAELKALAKKKKISLAAGAKKEEIIKILAKGAPSPSKKRGTTAGEALKAIRKTKTPKAAAEKKPSGRTAGVKKVAAGKKPVAKNISPSAVAAVQAPLRRPWQMPAGVEEPFMEQERVADAKYYTGTAEEKPTVTFDPLTHEYGSERMALLARDPYMAFSYWELPQARLEKEKAWFGWDSKLCVRVYDVTGVLFDGSNATAYFDQEVYDRVGSWYFEFGRPMHSFCADLGLLSPNGRFLTMIRSNAITMPRDSVSDVLDEEWMLVDEEFMKLYGGAAISGGFSSQQAQELMSQRRMLKITSPGLFSKPKAKK